MWWRMIGLFPQGRVQIVGLTASRYANSEVSPKRGFGELGECNLVPTQTSESVNFRSLAKVYGCIN